MGAIKVNNLGKAYKYYTSRWLRLFEWLIPGKWIFHQLNWVLKDINFSVQPGEAVGIIGVNGAGKSTLLKLISGTAQPSRGRVQMSGRVAALLELGMGFHPEFTGRENAYMAGQLLGLNRKDLAVNMPAIEAFAEIGDYIDMPVRVYSSGMQMRLAFSVATVIRPDILIIDEALSVGDAYFQHKSFERIREYREQGTTLLIVSHDKQVIQSICDRAILLNDGKIAIEGVPEVVMDYYNAMLADHQKQSIKQELDHDGNIHTISGSGDVYLENITLLNSSQLPVEVVNVGQNVSLNIALRAREHVTDLVVGYMIKDRLGQPVYGTNTHHLTQQMIVLNKGQGMVLAFEFGVNLGEGVYSIAVALHTDDTHLSKSYEWRDRALLFNVINMDKERFIGTAWLPPHVDSLK